MQALALTDHHGLAGAVEFYEACLGFEVQPILGLEIDVIASPAPVSRLVLLASDLEGWGSLCRLSSIKLTPVRDKGKTSTFVVDFGGDAAEINNKKPLSRTQVIYATYELRVAFTAALSRFSLTRYLTSSLISSYGMG